MNRRIWAWVHVGPVSSRGTGAPVGASTSADGSWFLGATASIRAAGEGTTAAPEGEAADHAGGGDPPEDAGEDVAGDDDPPEDEGDAGEGDAGGGDPPEDEGDAGEGDPPKDAGDDEAVREPDAARDGSTATPVGALGRATPGAAGVAAGTAVSGWACRPCRLRRLIGQESTGGTPVRKGSSCGARTVGRGRRPIGA